MISGITNWNETVSPNRVAKCQALTTSGLQNQTNVEF